MMAYYIHWDYPKTADDQLYYSGTDDEKLFHHKENAVKYAEATLEKYKKARGRFCELENKHYEGIRLTEQELHEFYELHCLYDCPTRYTVLERDIVFED